MTKRTQKCSDKKQEKTVIHLKFIGILLFPFISSWLPTVFNSCFSWCFTLDKTNCMWSYK